jgi:glucose/arabinose dehydrogenase
MLKLLLVLLGLSAVQAQDGPAAPAVGSTVEFNTDVSTGCTGCETGPVFRVRVVTVATGLVNPSSMAFLPDGQTMLVTERGGGGRLRILRRLVLDPQPIAGVPVADAAIAKRQFEHLISDPPEVHGESARLRHVPEGW